jgi:hypothetical protein
MTDFLVPVTSLYPKLSYGRNKLLQYNYFKLTCMAEIAALFRPTAHHILNQCLALGLPPNPARYRPSVPVESRLLPNTASTINND